MPPCCHIPPQGHYQASLQADCDAFSHYVAGHQPQFPAFTPNIISALHAEMKLWHAVGVLPVPPYRVNDIAHNSWRAACPQNVLGGHFNANERAQIFAELRALNFHSDGCVMADFDRRILSLIVHFRDVGLAKPGANNGNGPQAPTALATFGLCQKLVNIFLKYCLCWGQAGIAGQVPAPPPQLVNLDRVLCALHAPIDSVLLNRLAALPLGIELQRWGLLRTQGTSPRLRQCNGAFKPWSKLQCLRTYYGFQLVMRRLAMATWPVECACHINAQMHEMSLAAYNHVAHQEGVADVAIDWIAVAFQLGDDVFQQTIDAMA